MHISIDIDFYIDLVFFYFRGCYQVHNATFALSEANGVSVAYSDYLIIQSQPPDLPVNVNDFFVSFWPLKFTWPQASPSAKIAHCIYLKNGHRASLILNTKVSINTCMFDLICTKKLAADNILYYKNSGSLSHQKTVTKGITLYPFIFMLLWNLGCGSGSGFFGGIRFF